MSVDPNILRNRDLGFIRNVPEDPLSGLRDAVTQAGRAPTITPPPSADPAAPAAVGGGPGNLADIGGGKKLAYPAAQAFKAAQAELARMGIKLGAESAYRSPAEQYQIYAVRGVRPAAPAGLVKNGVPAGAVSDGTYWSKSLHSQGDALDISYTGNIATIRAVMAKYGFHQFNPSTDPNHFSYGRTG